jgi:adenylate cyclase
MKRSVPLKTRTGARLRQPPRFVEPREGGLDLIGAVADWLMDQALGEPELPELFGGCCARLRAAGVPLARAYIGARILHPLFAAVSYVWRPETGVKIEETPHHAGGGGFERSPHYRLVRDNVPLVRRKLAGPDAIVDFPLLEELRDQGMTDYFGFVVSFVEGWMTVGPASGMAGSWATDRPSGFSDADIQALMRIQRRLSVACKMRIKEMIARNVVTTYLGKLAGLRVLHGSIKRGDGETIRAAIWYSDLRNSTGLAERLDPAGYLAALNGYFECAAGPVLARGGEVLLLIGDAVLGIFPCEANRRALRAACQSAVAAASDAESNLAALNRTRAAKGDPEIDFGVALHVGELMFGNIGVPERLQFTVVGPAANEVARVQALTKVLGKRVLVSRDFADILPVGWESQGMHELAGLAGAREVLAAPSGDNGRKRRRP